LLGKAAALIIQPADGGAHAAGLGVEVKPGTAEEIIAGQLRLAKRHTLGYDPSVPVHDDQGRFVRLLGIDILRGTQERKQHNHAEGKNPGVPRPCGTPGKRVQNSHFVAITDGI
jgi:hypothetical protein